MDSPFKLPLRLSEDDRHNPDAVLDADGEYQFSAPIYYGHITAKRLRREAKRDKSIRAMLEKTDHIIATVNAYPAVVAFLESNIRDAVFLQRADARRAFVKQADRLLKQLGGE